MKNHKLVYFGCLLLLVLAFSCAGERDRPTYSWQKIQLGDSLDWKQPAYNDEHWEYRADVTGEEVFWTRLKVKLSDEQVPRKGYGIQVFATAAYEAYWDGVYLGTNGRLNTDGYLEVPGSYQWFSLVPDSLIGPGEHLLALRSTKSYRNPPGQHAYFFFDEYFQLTRGPVQVSKYMFLLAGIFLITAIYFLFSYATDPRAYATLIFGIICLAFTGLILMEYLKLFHLYPYPFQRTRLEIIDGLHVTIGILIPLFFMVHFNFRWKAVGLAVIVLVVGVLEYNFHENFDWIARQHSALAWSWSVLLVGYAIYEKRAGAIWVMTGLLLGFLVVQFMPLIDYAYTSSYDVSIFIAFVIIVLTMLYVMSLKRSLERRAYEASLVRSERLKNELLKKNIKPHFIMNTLTSLIDWVEESPRDGVAFIHALADEFELLNEIADYQQIPVSQEIRLCKNHLKVMGFRKEIRYLWEEEGIDANDIIPPAIIHTAVENGVSHGLPNEDGTIVFRLIFEQTVEYRQYTLQVRSRLRENWSPRPDGEGTGLQYIRARLRESYRDAWEIDSRAVEDGWATRIRIYRSRNEL